jgi:hypothetical protein
VVLTKKIVLAKKKKKKKKNFTKMPRRSALSKKRKGELRWKGNKKLAGESSAKHKTPIISLLS